MSYNEDRARLLSDYFLDGDLLIEPAHRNEDADYERERQKETDEEARSMAYCRFGPDSEVYAWEAVDGYHVAISTPVRYAVLHDLPELLEFMRGAASTGVMVPPAGIKAIEDEIAEKEGK